MSRKALTALLGLLLGLGVTELALRAIGVAAPPVPKIALVHLATNEMRYHCFPSNPDDAFDPMPASWSEERPEDWMRVEIREPPLRVGPEALDLRPWWVAYEYGSFGVRGPKVRSFPAPGTLRIVGIGDSFAMGEGVRFADTLFARLDQRLGEGVEVLNCGRSGADLALDVTTLEWAASTYAAPRAILVLTLNDIGAPGDAPADLMNVRDAVPETVAWTRIGAIVHGAFTASSRAASTERLYVDAHDPTHNREELARAARLLQRAAAMRGVDVVVVIYPLMYRLDADYPFEAAHAKLAALAGAAGLPVLDLLPAFRGQDATDLHVHPIDLHPNARAHDIAAETVARWLQREVPAFLRR